MLFVITLFAPLGLHTFALAIGGQGGELVMETMASALRQRSPSKVPRPSSGCTGVGSVDNDSRIQVLRRRLDWAQARSKEGGGRESRGKADESDDKLGGMEKGASRA